MNVLGATGSLLPVFLSSNALADKPPVAPTGICDVQRFPLRAVTHAFSASPLQYLTTPSISQLSTIAMITASHGRLSVTMVCLAELPDA